MSAKTNKRSRLNVSPGGKTAVVRVELSLLNGCPFDHVLPTNEIIEVWNKALNLKHIPLVRQANFRGPNKTFRINYRLKDPAFLSELINNPEISYERKGSRGIDVYSGRVLDVESIEEAKIGETVTVIIKRTNAELSEDQINEWLIRFGKIVLPPRYVFESNFNRHLCNTASWHSVTLRTTYCLLRIVSCSKLTTHQLVSQGVLSIVWSPVGKVKLLLGLNSQLALLNPPSCYTTSQFCVTSLFYYFSITYTSLQIHQGRRKQRGGGHLSSRSNPRKSHSGGPPCFWPQIEGLLPRQQDPVQQVLWAGPQKV